MRSEKVINSLAFSVLFIDFLAGIGKKLYICSRNWRKNLPIE